MNAMPLNLEEFGDSTQEAKIESLDYLKGLEEGRLQANATVNAQINMTLANLNATLSDAAFGYEEARLGVLKKLAPILAQIVDAIVPEILSETFGVHLLETLKSTIEAECAEGLNVLVSAETAETLMASGHADAIAHSISTHENIANGQAVIIGNGAGRLMDLEALSEALRIALYGIEQQEWTQSHG